MTDEINLDDALSQKFDELNQEEIPDIDEQSPETPEGDSRSAESEQVAEGGDDDEDLTKAGGEEDDLEPAFKIPPTTWDGESKKQYNALPSWAKRQIHKREQDVLNGIRSLKEQSSRFDPILQNHREFLDSAKIDPGQALNDAIALAKSLRQGTPEQRGRILRSIAEQYKADLNVFKEEVPEQVKFLQQYLAPLQNELGQIKQSLAGQNRPNTDEQLGVIAEFKAATDDKGQPKYPFFDALEERMAMEIPYIRQQNPGLTSKQLLEKAYEQAVWANPDTREFMRSEQAKQEQAQRQAQAAARKAELEKANKVNLNKRGGHDGEAPTETMDETLSATYDKLVSNFS